MAIMTPSERAGFWHSRLVDSVNSYAEASRDDIRAHYRQVFFLDYCDMEDEVEKGECEPVRYVRLHPSRMDILAAMFAYAKARRNRQLGVTTTFVGPRIDDAVVEVVK